MVMLPVWPTTTPITCVFWAEPGAIPEFLAPGSLTVESRLVLLSALHLEARWRVPFDPRLTQQRLFNCANGSSLPVDMMQMTGRFSYGTS